MAVRSVEENAALLSLDELRAALRAVGEERYHHQHPFHLLMHEGQLSRGQLQAWALNRYYYQSMIPIKDSIILSRGPDPEFRRAWRKRVVDHDGDATQRRRHQALAQTGRSHRTRRRPGSCGTGILPATRFAVNEYLNIVRSRSLAGSRGFFADRIVFPRPDHAAHGTDAPALSVALRRTGLFRGTAHAGARRRGVRHQLRFREREDARRAGTSDSGAARQVRHSVGATRRALFRLRAAGMASAGRVSHAGRRS